jgi:HK97 family phage prohead protease
METQNPQIERADFSQNRILIAEQSQQKWYKREQRKLIEVDQRLRLQAAREDNPDKRAELQRQLTGSAARLEQLNEGMRCSTLRAGLGRIAEIVTLGGLIEQRLTMSPPPGPVTSFPGTSDTAGKIKKLNGVAAVYSKPADIGGYFEEVIFPGAFRSVLSRKLDTRLLFNHNPDQILARTTNGTLRLYNAAVGLVFWGNLLETDPLSDGLAARIRRRDVTGCSFAFTVARDFWELQPGKADRRIIFEINELFDVGPVTYPAYVETTVAVVYEDRAAEAAAEYARFSEEFEEEEIAQFHRRYAERQQEIERGYRKAGRILNRNRQSVVG